ncbi:MULTISPECIES: SusC/RagA family TonB-linked outer membrane protein [unclassified Sphingobacterium]|uniref:SusC/RagA family TonB-linked outer membrane protein n=1 Tax=unclassified Sphingobacterium TaxID=2609468 RepID=UPI0025ECECA4|nr:MULTISPECIES: SusC/RagA family TonB-linked outer membrane protein [unclassified Sphingobacterium]
MKINLNRLSKKDEMHPAIQRSKDDILPTCLFHQLSKMHANKTLTSIVMKVQIIAFLMGIGLLQVHANSYGQNITLKHNSITLEGTLKEFEKQSGYVFFYKKADVNPVKNLSVHLEKTPLRQALNTILKDAGFSYEFFDKTVVLKKRPVQRPQVIIKESTLISIPQQVYIRGKVIDESGKPVAGASVRLKSDSRKGVMTTPDGVFTLPITANNETVVISSIGFKTTEVKVKLEDSPITVRLEKLEQTMKEVVVSTGIFKKEDKSFTGSSRTVTAEELKQFGNRNLVTSLRNIDPSFNIIESNSFGSNPNLMPEIQIRGNSSIPNVGEIQNESNTQLNTPLIILDGFQSNLRTLLDINENDVSSITILKDASATAMYGSRGANGVVVITTKLPKPGRLRVSFGSNLNVENADLGGYHLLKSRDKLELERLAGYYNSPNASTDVPLKRYYNFILNEVNSGVETDWLALPLRTSYGLRNNLRLEGGDGQFRYSAAVQSNNIAGVMKGSDRNTFNGTITLSYTYQNLLFRNYLNINNAKSSESPYGEFSDYVKQNPYWRPYDENGNVNKLLGNPGNRDYDQYWSTLPTNPLYNATLNTYDKNNSTKITNNTSVEWRIIPELNLRAQIGITKENIQGDRFRPAEHTAFANYSGVDLIRKGDYKYSIANGFSYDGSLNMDFNKKIKDVHAIYAGASLNMRQDEFSTYSFIAEGFPNANLDFITMGLQYAKGGKPTGNEQFNRAIGFVANLNYIYDNRYFADFVYRRDGSSQFGANQRFAPFWSAGIGWNIHEEAFFKENTKVNRLKLRGSIGTTGSTNFNSYQAMTTYAYFTDDRYFNWNGAYLLGYGNEDLKWQQALKMNIGTDIELFNRYLLLNTDYYVETTRDLVSSVNTPASNGFPSYTANIGRLRNKGFEVRATVFLKKQANGFMWSVTGAVLQNRNKVIETSAALKEAQKAIQNMQSDARQMYVEGYSSNAIWVVPSLGIDPSTGKELYLGADGNPTYTWRGKDVIAVGNTDPDLFGNFSTMIRYKGFVFNTSFRYRIGAQQYNSTLVERVEASNYKYNMDERVFFERWQKPGDNVPFKGITNTTPTYKSSRFVQDENTLIMQNFNIQYNFAGAAWLKKMRFENINISADVAEPMYLSTIRRERGTIYPFSRQFSLSINATF